MALVRATPLLTTAAQVENLTGVQDLDHLESGSTFTVTASLLRAHEWVFDRVAQRYGIAAVALLTNQSTLERAVAARFLEFMYAGPLDNDAELREFWMLQAREEVDKFRAEFPDDDERARSDQGIPEVGNFEDGWVYGPSVKGPTNQRYGRNLPDAWS